MPVVDCDTHLFESRNLWAERSGHRDDGKALRIADDENGNAWLMFRDRKLEIAEVFRPREVELMGEHRRRVRAGEKPAASYDESLPDDYWDPSARLATLAQLGVDETVVFPNYGLVWERFLADDLDATKLNMGAWNSWAVDVAAEGKGRLHPVAHLTLRDADWLDDQLRVLSNGGVRLAMVAPALVNGHRLSDPEMDRVWASFVEHGVTPVFHVGAFDPPYSSAWHDGDVDTVNPVLSSVFIWAAPALALADMAINGAFDRHPELRLGVMELAAVWVPLFLLMLDGGYDFHGRQNGLSANRLPLRPSEYVKRQVRIAAFSYEQPDRLIQQAGDLFMFCSDYPHTEGTDTPRDDYRRSCPAAAEPEQAPGLYGGNIDWLLRK